MPTINWFPGHMAKARREISEKMSNMDLIIEILDARIPSSSENPLVNGLRKDTPCLKVLNKSDLADPKSTKLWLEFYNKQPGVTAIAVSQTDPKSVRAILKPYKKVNAMILGIPNVGKSTIINILAKRAIAKTGNEPAVTKGQQRIALDLDIVLWDTPGFLWPKLEPPSCAYRLAVTGAIKASVIDFEDVACFLVDTLRQAYPEQLAAYFDIPADLPDTISVMDAIAMRRAFFKGGKIINYHRVSELLLSKYRQGGLGRISLETPEVIEQERLAYACVLAEKEEKKKARQQKKRK
ncbi:MAG: ribosome biogenesis GTPase YlqF [Coxiellaceae bacterium]|nr:ribosome biogenesis GTPase YlqF [Coxiellaceae bacterium]